MIRTHENELREQNDKNTPHSLRIHVVQRLRQEEVESTVLVPDVTGTGTATGHF